MKDSNSDVELQLLKKDFEYLKEAINKINNKLDDEDRIYRIITKKFDQEMLVFKNKYYNFFYVILGGTFVTAVTLYKTFIK